MQMSAALDPKTEREDSIWGLPENKTIKNFRGEIIADYSVPVSEYQNDLFPLNKLLNASEWRREYNKYWEYRRDKSDLFDKFEAEIIESFKQYLIPVIIIQKQTPKEAICQVFEKVNTGGVSLTVFELLTATFAADGFELRKDWETKKARLTSLGKLGAVAKVLGAVQNDDVLQAITLLATYDKRNLFLASGGAMDQAPGISCKRRDILKLTLEDYKVWSDKAIDGFIRAGRLIYSQKIFDARDLPYRTQLVPLAAILTMLQEKAEIVAAKEKLVQWYWCGVLGELYGGAIETRFANDLPEVLSWVDGSGREPRTVADANFHRSRLYTLQTRNSAAYKGISALLMRDGGFDFISGVPITLDSIWETLSSSQYLRDLGSTVSSNPEDKVIVIRGLDSLPSGVKLTVNRDIFERGLPASDSSAWRLHFATYGDTVFGALLEELGCYELLPCAVQLSEPVPDIPVEVIAYAVATFDGNGSKALRLVTSWEDLNGLALDESAVIDPADLESLREELRRIVRNEFDPMRAVGRIEKENLRAGIAGEIWDLLVAQSLLKPIGSSDDDNFWATIKNVDDILNERDQLLIADLSVEILKTIKGELLPDIQIPNVGDKTTVTVPIAFAKAGIDAGYRIADAMKEKKSELSLGMVSSRIDRELKDHLKLWKSIW